MNKEQHKKLNFELYKRLPDFRKKISLEERSEEYLYLDIITLFNAVELEFQGQDYPDLTEKTVYTQIQNTEWVTPLVQPRQLEVKQGEHVHLTFTGCYSQDELSIYFSIFQDYANG